MNTFETMGRWIVAILALSVILTLAFLAREYVYKIDSWVWAAGYISYPIMQLILKGRK